MQHFFETYHQFIHQEDILIIAVSGGVDSMVLLDLLLKRHSQENTIVAHFDHSLRGAESDGDREFIVEYCREKGVICEVEKMDIGVLAQDEKMSVEAIARKYRYAFLWHIARKYRANNILTAHHLDDRIETAIFNLIRGTKLGGIHALGELQVAGGMLQVESEILEHSSGIVTTKHIPDTSSGFPSTIYHPSSSPFLLRPLLRTSKSEILVYATERNIPYREDSTNLSTDYQRNYIRHEVLPRFETINPEYRQALGNFIDYTEDMKSWIDAEVSLFLSNKTSFRVEDFEIKSSFFQKEIIRYCYEHANQGTIGLSEGNIDEVLRFILTAHGGTTKHIAKLHLSKNKHIITIKVL